MVLRVMQNCGYQPPNSKSYKPYISLYRYTTPIPLFKGTFHRSTSDSPDLARGPSTPNRPEGPALERFRVWGLGFEMYRFRVEGQVDVVSRLVSFVAHIETPVAPIINLLTKSP